MSQWLRIVLWHSNNQKSLDPPLAKGGRGVLTLYTIDYHFYYPINYLMPIQRGEPTPPLEKGDQGGFKNLFKSLTYFLKVAYPQRDINQNNAILQNFIWKVNKKRFLKNSTIHPFKPIFSIYENPNECFSQLKTD